MNRKIKFRAWFPSEKRITPSKTVFELCENAKQYGKNLDSELILLQYTGLKDKNGVEIFEGDVVKNECRTWEEEEGEEPTYSNKISSIIYRNHGFWVDDESFGWEGEDLWDWDEIKIIGNIYENPELLTNKNN